MISKKQDLNGVRTPEDVERRHNLGAISGLESDVEELKDVTLVVDTSLNVNSEHPVQNAVITRTFNTLNQNKVDKISGKGLSTNDFTDTYKENVDNNTLDRHYHLNKTLLDDITSDKLFSLDKVYPVGSIFSTIDSTFIPTTSLGGSWQSVGTQTIGTDTIYLHKRIG